MSSLPTVVTEHGNGRFAARANHSLRGCGMVHSSRTTLLLGPAKLRSEAYGAITFGDLVGKLGRVRIECAKCKAVRPVPARCADWKARPRQKAIYLDRRALG